MTESVFRTSGMENVVEEGWRGEETAWKRERRRSVEVRGEAVVEGWEKRVEERLVRRDKECRRAGKVIFGARFKDGGGKG